MQKSVQDLVVARATTDSDLESMAYVRGHVNGLPEPPPVENLRHHLDTSPALTYLVAHIDGEPAGCGFVDTTSAAYAAGDISVVPELRSSGVGSALFAAASRAAHDLGKGMLQGHVREDDLPSRRWVERRGFRVVGAEKGLTLELADAPPFVGPPDGVVIVARGDRGDLLDGMYAVACEGDEDIPGSPGTRTFEDWRAFEIDRPTRRADLCFVALAGDEVIGYAALDAFGDYGSHGLTAVKRTWRRRGVATALKHAEIAAAQRAGFRRLVTSSEERNLPMQRLNETLGYRPDPSQSGIVVRGPLAKD